LLFLTFAKTLSCVLIVKYVTREKKMRPLHSSAIEVVRSLLSVFVTISFAQFSYAQSAVAGSSKNLFIEQLKYEKTNELMSFLPINHLLLAENSSVSKTKNPLRAGKICKEFLVGELCGVLCSFPGALIGSAFASDDVGIAALGYGIAGMYFGYASGTSIGVYVAGNDKQEKGSYLTTLGGCIIGTWGGIRIFNAFDQKGLGSVVLMLGPPIGSIIGFNLFRKARESRGNAFINYDQGTLKCSLGKIHVHYDYYSKPVLHVHLFQGRF